MRLPVGGAVDAHLDDSHARGPLPQGSGKGFPGARQGVPDAVRRAERREVGAGRGAEDALEDRIDLLQMIAEVESFLDLFDGEQGADVRIAFEQFQQ